MPPGQWDRRALTQGTWWVDGQARVWRLAEMTEPHLRGVLDMLSGRARLLHLEAMVDALLGGLANPDALTHEVLAHQASASLVDVTPEDFLGATPLVRAIRAELRRRQA